MYQSAPMFPHSEQLPAEVPSRIRELAIPSNSNQNSLIEIHFTQIACYHNHTKGGKRAPKVDYMFKLDSPAGSHGPPIAPVESREAYAEFERRYPNELRLNKGQSIRFNASQHTIFMSRESLFALGQYLWLRDAATIHRNLKGFNDIQTLGTPMPHCVREGFVSKKAYGLRRHALSGVTNYVVVNDVPGVPHETMAKTELVNKLDAQLRDLLALRNWSPKQVEDIWDVRSAIAAEVDMFFGPPNTGAASDEIEESEEEGLNEARVLEQTGNGQDEGREQCNDDDCGFCRMQSWEERLSSSSES